MTTSAPPQLQRAPLHRVVSAFHDATGAPRFVLNIPSAFMRDAGVGYLVKHETEFGGYEYATRAFLDAHLTAETTFVDVGAHWGVFALQALTAPQGVKKVIAIEAHPQNVQHMRAQLALNPGGDGVRVIETAAGAEPGSAPLVLNSTMGNSLHGLGLPQSAPQDKTLTVSVAPLDDLLKDVLADTGPIILKIDVEGFEPEVWQGMQALVATGRVKAIVWEKGLAFESAERRSAVDDMLTQMTAGGYTPYRFAHPELGGPLLPYAHVPESLNVFSLAKDFKLRPGYGEPGRKLKGGRVPPLSPACRAAAAGPRRAVVTETMIQQRATDASRWVDYAEVSQGAEARAQVIQKVLPPDVHVVDLGCGIQALRTAIKSNGSYTPADLVQWTPDTKTCDLNAGRFPRGVWDYAVLSHVLDFTHDPLWVLRQAAERAHRLIVLMAPPVDQPLAEGRFWTPTQEVALTTLKDAGWHVRRLTDTAQGHLIEAERLSLI